MKTELNLSEFLAQFRAGEVTSKSWEISTQCLYPSFQPVSVFVHGRDTIKVTDGGNAFRVAWDHGRDERLIKQALTRQAQKFGVEVSGVTIEAEVSSLEWLPSAVMSVANASSHAAHSSVEKIVAASEGALKDRVAAILAKLDHPRYPVVTEYEVFGKSGKQHRFDFAIVNRDRGKTLLIDTVTPHHVSISAKFVAFTDASTGDNKHLRFAVFDSPLQRDDAALLSQVADLVPVRSLHEGTRRVLLH